MSVHILEYLVKQIIPSRISKCSYDLGQIIENCAHLSRRRLRSLLLMLLLLSFANVHYAETAAPTPETFLQPNYVGVDVTRNTPTGFASKDLSGGGTSLLLGFKHVLRDSWIMGVSSGYKEFRQKKTGEDLSVFVVSQDSQFLYRVNHPVYFSVGPKFMYLLPTEGQKLPPKRHRDFDREIAVGASLSLYYALTSKYLLSFRIDSWRGVNRRKFSAFETGVGLQVAL
jgi:hypothetical protein